VGGGVRAGAVDGGAAAGAADGTAAGEAEGSSAGLSSSSARASPLEPFSSRFTRSKELLIVSRLIKKRPKTRMKKPSQKTTAQDFPFAGACFFFAGVFVFVPFRTATSL
jgi:hypothetical protein